MTLDAGGHALDLLTNRYHGSAITHLDALCHYSFEGVLYNGLSKQRITEAGCGVPVPGGTGFPINPVATF